MQSLEVSGSVRLIYKSLGVKGLIISLQCKQIVLRSGVVEVQNNIWALWCSQCAQLLFFNLAAGGFYLPYKFMVL